VKKKEAEKMTHDPNTTKYLIKAKIFTDGIVEKPDVVGAIFGQTEGLLGDELDLRDLQKSGRIGRIEVMIDAKRGRSEGEIIIPSSLDQVESAILASALETIDRVGPCKSQIKVDKIEDVRFEKRQRIVDRAKQLLLRLIEDSKGLTTDLTESVRAEVQVEEITSYGKNKCPAGPNIDGSDAIIVVEGRSDVINLLRHGIKNVIAVEGTSVPETIRDLCRDKIVTIFVDGDRGGELILKELLQVAEIDFVAKAPSGREVEELSGKQLMKCLRNKLPVDQFLSTVDWTVEPQVQVQPQPQTQVQPQAQAQQQKTDVKAVVEKKLSVQQQKYKNMLSNLTGTSKALLLDTNQNVICEVAIRDLPEQLKSRANVSSIIFDGIISQRLFDIAEHIGVSKIIANRLGNVTKQPEKIEVLLKHELE
jgi:DNA primase